MSVTNEECDHAGAVEFFGNGPTDCWQISWCTDCGSICVQGPGVTMHSYASEVVDDPPYRWFAPGAHDVARLMLEHFR